MAAFYMFYTALQLFQERAGWSADKENVMMAAIAFFVIAGIGLIVFAIRIAKRVTEKEKRMLEEKEKDESETD